MHWLLKTEPDAFSWADQCARGPAGEPWTGVRNPQARAHLRAMRLGDLAFFYHTGGEKRIMGVVEVVREAYAEPGAETWSAVDVAARAALNRPVTLAEIKADPLFADLPLVRAPRLSVQPVPAEAFERILLMSA